MMSTLKKLQIFSKWHNISVANFDEFSNFIIPPRGNSNGSFMGLGVIGERPLCLGLFRVLGIDLIFI